MGGRRPVETENGFRRSLFTMSPDDGDEHYCAYTSFCGFIREPMLQLSHAAHDFWFAARDPQPSGFFTLGEGNGRLRAAECLQSLSSRSNAGVDGEETGGVVSPAGAGA